MERKGQGAYGRRNMELTNTDKNIMMLFMGLGKEGQRQFLSLPEGADFERMFTDYMIDASTLFLKKDKIQAIVHCTVKSRV